MCHFIIVLSNHNEIPRISKFCGKIFIFLSLDFYTENPFSKLFLTRTFLFVNRFSEFLLHILRLNCAKKIFHLDLNSCKISAKKRYQALETTLIVSKL